MGAEHGWNRAAGQASAIFALGLSARWIYVRQAGDQPLWDIPVGTAITFVERAGSGVSEFVSPYDALLTVAAASPARRVWPAPTSLWSGAFR